MEADPRLELDAAARRLRLAGRWTLAQESPDVADLLAAVPAGGALAVDAAGVEAWDSTLGAFVRSLDAALQARGDTLALQAAPDGLSRLLALARPAAPTEERSAPAPHGLRHRMGRVAGARLARMAAWAEFAGRIVVGFGRLATGRVRVPLKDFTDQFVECGPRALPIVMLLSLLIGAITAFVGVVQLRAFNADIYVADLVGLAMLLELGALMTGIIMAGRAGAAFAAALGTMQTNEEIDALATLGLDPVEFLVLPRVLALLVCTPLLALYADFMGILGGVLVGAAMLDISPASFINEMAATITAADGVKGLIKALAYGALVGFAGCLRGMECDRSAAGVGRATTSAVVTAIVLIVLADAGLTLLYFVRDGEL